MDFKSPTISLRAMDESSKRYSLINLESHLRNGVLSENEMRRVNVKSYRSLEGEVRMMTFPDEISVYSPDTFLVWKFLLDYNLAVIIDAPLSTARDKTLDHPVILDSLPLSQRKIVGIYFDSEQVNHKAVSKIVKNLKADLPLFHKRYQIFNS